jgi:predicted membrane metal-binding protein
MSGTKPHVHEDYTRVEKVEGPSNRSFGVVFTAFFALVGLWPMVRGEEPRIWALVVSAVFLLFTLLLPRALAPLNRVWAAFGLLLHKIVSPVVLGLVFFGVVTPTGYLMRRAGKRPLHLDFDRQARSYWVLREPAEPDEPAAERMKRQF